LHATVITKALAAAADNNICTSQAAAGAGDLTIDGALAAGGVATLDTGRQVIITSGGNDTGRTFTIYGTDEVGVSISESVTGASGAAAASTYHYKTVTRVAVSGAVATTVKVGTNGVGASKGVLLDIYANPFNVALLSDNVTGSANWTVQYTYSNHRAAGFHWGNAVWVNHSVLASKSSDTADSLSGTPVTGVRLLINSGTGTVAMTVRQAG
jgi:hypothetical protein